MEAVRPRAAKLGLETPLELWGYFTAQCRTFLHVVLCMSPIGSAFRERLRQNPSLVNCCTIDWFQRWPADALEAVALKFLREMDGLEEEQRAALVGLCQAFHSRITAVSEEFLAELGRNNYVTPTSYLELITAFRTLLEAKRAQNSQLKKRYLVGLEKLASSAQQVAGMQSELRALQPQLVRTVAEVEQLMVTIAREKAEVVEPKAAIVKAIPILNEALAALDTIKEADITYIKKLANPPGAIKLVLEAVCVVLDVKPGKVKDDSGKMVNDYWKSSVALLNERDFLQRLKTYDKDNIPPRIIAEIRKTYLSQEGFTPETAKKASPAAEGMCKWVHAMSSYDKVAKVVAPKKAKLAEAEGVYESVMVGLRAKQSELATLRGKLAGMENDLSTNTAKKVRLEAEVALCSVKLERAEKLIGGLGGERARWTDTAESLARAYVNLTGDMLISAGIVAYAGAFTAAYRTRVIDSFVELCRSAAVPHTSKFSLGSILGEPVRIREWLIATLPNDAFSIENAIIIANARRWPLCIDPQGQANKWIKTLEKPNNLAVIKLSEGGEYMRTLENAVQFGLPVLLENVGEELDPSLEPLLLKQVFKQGGVSCIRLGDTTVEYSNDFRFYITTKLRNPHYLPEVAVKVTLLNFMITRAGLSDQMLGVAVATERPDLEEQKAMLVVQGAEASRKLKEIEDKILEVLSSSTGNILEDETAISVITEAKTLGNDIADKQQIAEVTEREIDSTRAQYKPCGDYTSVLFFCISDLAAIDPMYQYSLPWYSNLFVASVNAAAKDPVLDTRLRNIFDHFTYSLYCNVCRSLFEKDKLLFAFLLCARIMESKSALDPDDWLFLLTGGLAAAPDRANPAPAWLVDRGWKEILRLSLLPAFMGLDDSFAAEPNSWRVMHEATEPHLVTLPGLWNSLDSFRKLLIVRCIRPDKVVPAVQDFVETQLGKKYVEPPAFNLSACYGDSSPTTPLIFVLSAGSDPTAALLQFAGEKNMASRLTAVSLGQGQGPKAAALIAEGIASGAWVLLQNCHLAPSWMPSLDKICEELNPETVNPEFRYLRHFNLLALAQVSDDTLAHIFRTILDWHLTSLPFSPAVRQAAPAIIQATLFLYSQSISKLLPTPTKSHYVFNLRDFARVVQGCMMLPPSSLPVDGGAAVLMFKRLWVHEVARVFQDRLVDDQDREWLMGQERRKFGPLGFNISYGFDDGDMRISVRQLHMFLSENEEVPYAALRYVTGECNYGGRVTDDKDRILLNTLLKRVYCPEIILDPMYKLSASGLYAPPPEGPRSSYLAYIDTLPIIPLPEAFGLHANADISKDQADTNAMFSSLLSMSGGGGGQGGGGGGSALEERVAAVVAQCLQRLPADFDIEAVQKRWPVLYEESLNTVLAQEMSRFNRLLGAIRGSLKAMDLALRGLQVMSAELEAAFRSISIAQVPELWRKVSYPSLKPLGSYLDDLYRRLKMLSDWHEQGPPTLFWLPGFFFVQSFLTAGLQNYARRHTIPIDMVRDTG
ncbi:uncharacterized protein HaLaN_19578 [Haematococcus lacustris]|uniref:Dynein heavy chain n=1 Tax=Haematococcus lacustris TaxID=44745 RepID=A0A699ZR57_HAELA|nr:uncharacterized protein HaLaN_19578 [Haematococcus lacustris]